MKIIQGRQCTFCKDNKPEAVVQPGELLEFHTKDCFGGQITSEDQIVTSIDFSLANPTAGPVYVEGAKAGDVLVVDILDIQVADVGFACIVPNLGPLRDVCKMKTKMFHIKDGYTDFNGVTMKLDPMVGTIGVAPQEGFLESGFANRHGGNMDSRLIKKGARVYFPVYVDGALLQMGDLHAVMGDGELAGTGLEIDGTVLVKVDVIKNFEINFPVTYTQDRWYVNSKGVDYDESLILGVAELTRLMTPVYNWDIEDLAMYIAMQGAVEVNQGARPDAHGGMVNLRLSVPQLPQHRLIP